MSFILLGMRMFDVYSRVFIFFWLQRIFVQTLGAYQGGCPFADTLQKGVSAKTNNTNIPSHTH